MPHVLVVGGAGYIGSHMVKRLRQAGAGVTVLDDLSTGHADAVIDAELVQGSLADPALLAGLFASRRFDAVMHFASRIEVGLSMTNPHAFYQTNIGGTLNLLGAMLDSACRVLVFSSTAAVYGSPQAELIAEDHPCDPASPYGRSKWMVEQLLADYTRAHGLNVTPLRYFNAAGADPDGALGERHMPETHLIPLVLQVASGRRTSIAINGTDYPTPDGTCIRDYVHVADLADAHLLALERLLGGGESRTYNLGNGQGFSVQEVVATARQVTGRPIASVTAPRRPGDPACLVACSARARQELGWRPRHQRLDTIITHAWGWEQTLEARQRGQS